MGKYVLDPLDLLEADLIIGVIDELEDALLALDRARSTAVALEQETARLTRELSDAEADIDVEVTSAEQALDMYVAERDSLDAVQALYNDRHKWIGGSPAPIQWISFFAHLDNILRARPGVGEQS